MDIAGALIKQLGFDPKQLQAAVVQAINDCASVKTEVMAAKAGFIGASQHFNARLVALEQNAIVQTRLLTAIAHHLGLAADPQPENEDDGTEHGNDGQHRLNGKSVAGH